MKKCKKCGIEKPLSDFGKDKTTKNGFTSQCKICRNKSNQKWRQENSEYRKEYEQKYRAVHIDFYINYNKEYRASHKEYYKQYDEKYYQNDNNKLARYLRNRLRNALQNNQKIGSAVFDLGCTIEELKWYLELQFYDNIKTGEKMTWNNYGLYGWHIDHIIPLSLFDLTNKQQFLNACHYTNLQPLWAYENISKSNKIGIK